MGASQILLPLAVETVKDIINSEMDAVAEESRKRLADATDEGTLSLQVTTAI